MYVVINFITGSEREFHSEFHAGFGVTALNVGFGIQQRVCDCIACGCGLMQVAFVYIKSDDICSKFESVNCHINRISSGIIYGFFEFSIDIYVHKARHGVPVF